jgi:hypothetical protein
MILGNLGCYKLKATPGVKTTSPAPGAKISIDNSNSNLLNSCLLKYNQAGKNHQTAILIFHPFNATPQPQGEFKDLT